MNPRIKRGLIPAVVAGLLAAGVYYGWKTLHPSGPGEDFISGNGRMEATEIDVVAKSGGRVLNIFANEGDFARAGQPLAQMQVDALEAQHDEVLAQYQQAIQSVANAEAQLAARHSDKAAAEAALAQRESDVAAARAVVSQRESDVEAAQAVVGERESELDAARRRLARSQVLSKEGASSIQENDDDRSRMATAEAALKAATAQVAAARAAVDAAKAQVATAGAAVSAARAQVATAEATINATQAQVAGVQRAVLASKAAIARVGVDIKDTTLTSPRDGRVQFRVAQPGEVVGAGGKILNLVDLSDVYMTFFVPEAVAGKIALGSEARITLDAAPQYVAPAKVSFVASVAQFTPKTVETASERQKLMFRVKAQIDPELLRQQISQVKTGMPGVA